MRYASVCDGIGAAHVAWQPLGWDCAWTSEIEPFPSAVVDERWKLKNVGDMTKLTEEQLQHEGRISLLVGGTPCQSFSVAGLRKGLEDPRGNLALRFTQLVGVLRPTWVVWENVPGVLSSAGGRDFGTFLGALAELGYGFAYRILDAQWFGVAQRRRRVFVVAHARDWRRAAAVLFERESVFGNSPTREAERERVTSPIAGCPNGGGANGPGRTADDADSLVPVWRAGDQANSEHCFDHAGTLNCDKGQQGGITCFHPTQDPISSEDGLTHALGTGSSGGCATAAVAMRTANTNSNGHGIAKDVAHTSDQAQGQCVAFKPLAFNAYQRTQQDVTWPIGASDGRKVEVGVIHHVAVAFKPRQSEAAGAFCATEDFAPTIQSSNNGSTAVPAVAFANRTRDGIKVPEVMSDGLVPALTNPGDGGRSDAINVAYAFRENQRGEVQYVDPPHALASGGGKPGQGYCGVQQAMAVRRLTPRECERLQGFPDDYTLVTYRNKPAADGPRYKALGNSMAVPVMRWIGERIAQVDSVAGDNA